jgi:CheY-like chemotaxis protein
MIVFYADDDAEEIEFFSEAVKLIDPSIECVTAVDGANALEVLEKMPVPDLIFLDMNMPKMNGAECLRAIREKAAFDEVPVVIYSSSVSKRETQNIIFAGANYVLIKQNSITRLRDELHSILAATRPLPAK